MLTKLTLEGFKSFRKLELELRPLNVLIGANGAGKSNFISFFKLLDAVAHGRLKRFVGEVAGSETILRYGKKVTQEIRYHLEFSTRIEEFILRADQNDSLFVAEESSQTIQRADSTPETYSGEEESSNSAPSDVDSSDEVARGLSTDFLAHAPQLIFDRVREIAVFHFVDTTPTSRMKNIGRINDNLELRSDGENLAAMLYLIKTRNPKIYQMIRDVIQSVAPYFDDFLLEPNQLNEDTIQLKWNEGNSDHLFFASDLSDGTLRFMALATLLLQPNPPAITVIDEPELGLHPFAIEELAGLLRVASSRTQLIVATQSPQLISALEPEDVIVADRENGETTLRRLDAESLEGWLEEYTLGELWQKNILGGVVNPNRIRSRSNS